MKKYTFITLCTLLLFMVACHRKTAAGDHFAFSDFVASVSKATYNDYKGKPGVQVQDEAAFTEMKNYLLKRYQGVHVKESFAGLDSQVVDCIPINEQPAFRLGQVREREVNRQPPVFTPSSKTVSDSLHTKLPVDFKSIDITLKKGQKDMYGHERYCPEGYIPVKRVTLDILTHFKTLDEFFGKTGIRTRSGDVPAPYGDGYDHNHVVGIDNVDNAGGDSWLNLWNPNPAPGIFSLSQQWFTGGSDNGLQTIEGGWQVYSKKYNTDNACLFIYSTNANYSKGSGGYNLDNGAFIQLSNQVYLAAPFDHYSATNGGQWGFNLQWKRNTDGNWWLFYKGPADYIAVGYYPKSFYGSGQMSNFAQTAEFGGEVAGSPKEGQMGSGAKADQGWQKAAYQNFIFYIQKDHIDQSTWTSLSKTEENAGCYTGDVHNIYGDWGTYMYFGGNNCN